MRLGDLYERVEGQALALLASSGYATEWIRQPLPVHRRLSNLDALPVGIQPRGEGWVVSFGFGAIGGTEWMEFDAHVRGLAMVKLATLPNLRKFAREHGVQYSALWRAKSDAAKVTDRIVEMMGVCPEGAVRVPEAGSAKEVPTLTRGQFNTLMTLARGG